MKLNWTRFKAFVDERLLSIQWLEDDDTYYLVALDGVFRVECVLEKDPSDTVDLDDFVNNYKALGNKSFTDGDGRVVQKTATARKGWNFFEHIIEVTTGKLNGTFSKKCDNTDRGLHSLHHYEDVGGVETLMVQGGSETDVDYQIRLTNDCVRTDMVLEPDYDYELIGGNISQKAVPGSDLYLWVVGGATDLPGFVGVKEFIGGKNLDILKSCEYQSDGRTAKFMKLVTDGVPAPTNKLQFIFRHDKGVSHRVEICVEYFRE